MANQVSHPAIRIDFSRKDFFFVKTLIYYLLVGGLEHVFFYCSICIYIYILGSGSLFWPDILVSNDMGVTQIDVLSREDKACKP